MKERLIQLLGIFFLCASAVAQNSESAYEQVVAHPFVQNFSPQDYNGYTQNWMTTQDDRGFIYVANNFGILEYDGAKWRLIKTNFGKLVRVLYKDSKGRILVGARQVFGYLANPRKKHQLKFISLRKLLPKEYRDISIVASIVETSHGTYFGSDKCLIRWVEASATTEEHLDVLAYGTDATLTYGFQDEIFVRVADKGLMRLVGDQLEMVPGGDFFAQNRIHTMLPLGPQQALIGASLAGLHVYDGQGIKPFQASPAMQEFLQQYPIYSGTLLANGNIALACLQGALAIMSPSGELLRVVNEADGLRDGVVTHIFEDQAGGLWLTLFDGIARVEAQSPFSAYTKPHGLDMDLWDVKWYRERMYMCGTKGIYYLEPTFSHQPPSIRKIPEVKEICNSLTVVDGALWASTILGIYDVSQTPPVQIADLNAFSICPSPFHPELLYIAHPKGITIFKKIDDKWKSIGQVRGFSEEVQKMTEEMPGVLWAGLSKGYVKITLSDSVLGSMLKESKADPHKTFPAHIKSFIGQAGQGRTYLVSGKVTLANTDGLKTYDAAKETLIPDGSFSPKYTTPNRQITFVYEDPTQRVWIESFSKNIRDIDLWIPDGKEGYTFEATPFHRLRDFDEFLAIYINEANPDILWLAGDNGLIRYDHRITASTQPLFPAAVRKLVSNGDSLVFDGLINPNQTEFELPYRDNAIRFEYALPAFDDPDKTEYRFRMDGFDEKWSKWTQETQKDYTNLREGTYRFRVKGRNIYREESAEGIFEFTILPPWYRSWWAYTLYIILAISGIYALLQWRTRQLKARTEELEAIVLERTQEVRLQKDQLEVQAEQLKELDREKSRFFTNISHEFRTPLTVILGMVDTISGYEKARKLIKRNSHNLLELINQILDLRKLESGKLEIEYIQGNIIQYLNYIAESFSSLADLKRIQLSFDTHIDELFMDYDIEKTLRIVSNLLSNAIKFTPAGGEVKLRVRVLHAPKTESSVPFDSAQDKPQAISLSDFLVLRVSDTGKGIPADKLPHVFDQFYQADNSSVREGEGTGIGLALTQELVTLLDGAISVDSEVGKGTTFMIQLPIRQTAPLAEDFKTPILSEPSVPEVEETTATPSTPAARKEGMPTVLVTEDNADVVEYLLTCLNDYEVLVAKDGQEGIETALEEIPDLIVSDVMMPRKNGFELLKTLKTDNRTSHIPIIMLTAKTDADSRISGFERGADAYLAKPFNKEELLIRIRKLIELRQLLQARYTSTSDLPPSEDRNIIQEDAFILRLKEVLESNLTDEAFRVPELCKAMGMSRSQMHRKITALTGRSLTKYIRLLRLLKAKEFLKDPTLTMAEIGYMVGFNSPSYFTRCYVEEFGEVPSEGRG